MESMMSLLAQSAKAPRTSAVARNALSLQNQQVSPSRGVTIASQYDLMIRKLDVKPSAHEVLLTFSPN